VQNNLIAAFLYKRYFESYTKWSFKIRIKV